MLKLPATLVESARRNGLHAADVLAWFHDARAQMGVAEDASPADWPAELWEAYRQLRNCAEPGTVGGGSARRLFTVLAEVDTP